MNSQGNLSQGQEELLRGICTMQVITKSNPCGMKDIAMWFLGKGLKVLLSRSFFSGLSQDKVAEYMKVSTRTLQHWQKEYKDFPRLRHDGFHRPSYDAVEVVDWWEQHKDKIKHTA